MIKVIYNKTCGRCVQSEPLTSGMVGQPIHFEYSHDFDGLTLTAVFTNGKTTVDVLNPGNQCVIPHEVLDTVGTLVKVGIYATKGNELVIPTVYATIGIVLKGADSSGDVSADPTLPVWAQMQALMGNLNDLNTEARSNLVAAINEAAQSGGGGGSSIPKPLTYDYMPEGYPTKSGWSIEWDGNTDGLVSATSTYYKYYKVSDMMPTDDELIGATIKASNGISLKLSSDDITALSEDITLINDGGSGFVVRKDNVTVNDTLLPKKGTYFASADGFYIAELGNQTITPMAEEFLPPLVAEIKATAEAAQDTANRKVDIENPNFTGAFSHNRKADTVIGERSFAEGDLTTASGNYSHAEGHGTTAGGRSSHAEGEETTASGSYSHAEGGNTSASGQHSHAEGQKTIASGSWSHAEGYDTTASGYRSHAEGIATKASGEQSHAEGEFTIASGNNAHAEGHGTIASGHNSHVEGKYNIEDTNNKYAHIVGNGTSATERSNAYTLDWEGNGCFSGTIEADANILRSSATDSTKKFKLTVDDSGVPSLTNTEDSTEAWTPSDVPTKTSQLENDSGFVAASELASGLAGKQDTLIQSGAAVGQIAKITAVDASGVPTAWAPVDMPSGGGGGKQLLYRHNISQDTVLTTDSFDTSGANIDLSVYSHLYIRGMFICNSPAETYGCFYLNGTKFEQFQYFNRKIGQTIGFEADIVCLKTQNKSSAGLLSFAWCSEFNLQKFDNIYVPNRNSAPRVNDNLQSIGFSAVESADIFAVKAGSYVEVWGD